MSMEDINIRLPLRVIEHFQRIADEMDKPIDDIIAFELSNCVENPDSVAENLDEIVRNNPIEDFHNG